jgi:hypothetical protein
MADALNKSPVSVEIHRTSPYEYAQTAEAGAEVCAASEPMSLSRLQTVEVEVEILTTPWSAGDDLPID